MLDGMGGPVTRFSIGAVPSGVVMTRTGELRRTAEAAHLIRTRISPKSAVCSTIVNQFARASLVRSAQGHDDKAQQ